MTSPLPQIPMTNDVVLFTAAVSTVNEGDTPTAMIDVQPFHKGLSYSLETASESDNGCTFKKKAHLKFLHRMSPEMSTVMMILEDSNYNFKKIFLKFEK